MWMSPALAQTGGHGDPAGAIILWAGNPDEGRSQAARGCHAWATAPAFARPMFAR